ncbi:antibiotic biosynthesis monooxygenase family protein [Nonomuraea helvata]|uniref:Antibiotic biosynthesis monooxygenase n=1 Tax=Nonomuraea helvata TaxID=37484 RepID=A0ABV5SD30_9ACTN
MIARTWSGRVPHHHADGFAAHLLDTGVAEAASTPGNRGAQVLHAAFDDHVEFRLITYWESWEAIRHFAGDDVSRAVLYPGDERYELTPSPSVEHHHVLTGGCAT